MSKTNGTEATIDTPSRHDLPGNAQLFTFDPGGNPADTYDAGDFTLTSMAAAWFLRTQVSAWQEYSKCASAGFDYTIDNLHLELTNMHLNIMDLAALRNLLTTAIQVIDDAHHWEEMAHKKALETRDHSITEVPVAAR